MEQKVRSVETVAVDGPRRDLGRRLKAARKKAGLTQAQVGERLELSAHGAVGQWERGDTQVESVNLFLAAQLYTASLDWLAFGKMGTIEQRISALPETLREGMMEQVTAIVTNAERMWKRNPTLFGDSVVPDADPRLTIWSAKNKPGRAPAKKPKPKRK